jgi:acyl carrier protein
MTPPQDLLRELKELLVSELNLTSRDPASIEDDAPLFGSGLNLDSLDALQIAMFVEERYGVAIPNNAESAKPIFASVRTLAAHIDGKRKPRP